RTNIRLRNGAGSVLRPGGDRVDRLDAVAAAALGEVQSTVVLGDAPEVVVLAGLVRLALVLPELQQRVHLGRIIDRGGNIGRPGIDRIDNLDARRLRHIRRGEVGVRAEGRGIAVV